MTKRIALFTAILLATAAVTIAITASKDELTNSYGLTVHEWGTFTTVAGLDGQPEQWLPLSGASDLPCFVNHFKNGLFKNGPLLSETPLDYPTARKQLLGSVRMETPVLYFYSDRPVRADVRVAFPRGFITEWFPSAEVNQLVVTRTSLQKPTAATIRWKDVEIMRSDKQVDLAQGKEPSHYYAARETDANPLRVQGTPEKFLFYRGVGNFPVPINVTVSASGTIHLKHLDGKPLVILFENHGGKLGYTVVDTTKGATDLDSPELTKDFEALRHELETSLVNAGLFAREAKAMVDTWRDSWFEEGTRVFYIVPPSMVDKILPLTITPEPERVARVFVGRVEVLTPATLQAVSQAIASGDATTLAAYGRFLGPIAERLPESKQISNLLNDALAKYRDRAAGCSH